jgi:hypothetical protein
MRVARTTGAVTLFAIEGTIAAPVERREAAGGSRKV